MMNIHFLGFIRAVVAQMKRVLNFFKISYVKLRGVNVNWSNKIHWSTEIERSRGVISLGARTDLDRGVILRAYGGSIKIGEDCTVNPYSIIYGYGGVVIGNGVLIAAHTVIVPSNHIFSDIEKTIRQQGTSGVGIVIEDDVWIGAGVKVLDGVTVAKGTVVAAGSVVTKSTEPYSVVAGVPAKKISTRLQPPHQNSNDV